MARTTTTDAHELERQIQQTQANLDQVLDALETRLEPRNLVFDAVSSVWRSGATHSNASRFGDVVSRNPVPTLLIAIAGAWLAADAVRGRRSPRPDGWAVDEKAYGPLAGEDAQTAPGADAEGASEGASEGIIGAGPSAPEPATVYGAESGGQIRSEPPMHSDPRMHSEPPIRSEPGVLVTTAAGPVTETPPPPPAEDVVGAEPTTKSASESASVLAGADTRTPEHDETAAAADRVLVRPDGSPVSDQEQAKRDEETQGTRDRMQQPREV